jgi:light-harvesting complex II chlorophyll a/b binding protein 7
MRCPTQQREPAQRPESGAARGKEQQDQDQDQAPSSSSSSSSSGSSSAPPDSAATFLAKLAAEIVASPLFYLVAGLIAIKLVASTGESAASIFIFAALPVTALTALSKSSLGKEVQAQLEARLPQLQAEAQAVLQQHAEARQRSSW